VNFWALQHAVRQGSASKVMELLNLGSPGNVRAIRHPLGFYCLPVHRGTADRFGVCVFISGRLTCGLTSLHRTFTATVGIC
jgi:hypothetical protein